MANGNNKNLTKTILIIVSIIAITVLVGYVIVNQQMFLSAPTLTTSETDTEEIQILLNKEEWVSVIVTLKGNEFTTPEFRDDVRKKSEVQKIQNAVLATLTEDDFQISHQYQFSPSFAGMISKSGMEKLLKNSLVISISIDRINTAF